MVAPPRDSSVDDVEAASVTAIIRVTELVIPPQEQRGPGKVGGKTPERKLSCRLRLMRCTQRGSA